jgi:hypothetical protein
MVAGLSLAVASAACSGRGPAASPPRPSPAQVARARAQPRGSPDPDSAAVPLWITPAPYLLPAGIAGESVLASGRDLLIAGGITAATGAGRPGGPSTEVTRLDPVTGRAAPDGRLAAPASGAAAAVIGGRAYLFGGGRSLFGGGRSLFGGGRSLFGPQGGLAALVQALAPGGRAATVGRLPGARSGLAAATMGGTTYLAGGSTGPGATVLATRDGSAFQVVTRLPVAVRYPVVAAAGGQIWVLGGEARSGLTSDIQEVSPATGRATVAGHLPEPLAAAAGFSLGGRIYLAGGETRLRGRLAPTATVWSFSPRGRTASPAGRLPVAGAGAAAAVIGGTAFLVGGTDGQRPIPAVTELRPASAAPPFLAGALTGSAALADRSVLASRSVLARLPWLGKPLTKGHLAPGSQPSALPGDVLIADDWNNRLLIVDPQGRIRWEFPRPGDLAPGQKFLLPDDAFFSPDGRYIIATEEEDAVISVISIARHKIVYRYGTPGVPGSGPNHVSNPDDAMMMPDGMLIAADIKNCRLLLLAPPARHLHRPRKIIGGSCWHSPPSAFGSPNGAFPETNGDYLVTEINGDWADSMSLHGRVQWATHPPGVAYPSDTNEIAPGRYLTADYSSPGQVVEFSSRGRLLWRFGGLNQPSLALPLPNGDILVNDDFNDRVIVIDPVRHRIVWQYGHTGVPGSRPGYLNDPDGVDLTPPDSMLITHAPTMGRP